MGCCLCGIYSRLFHPLVKGKVGMKSFLLTGLFICTACVDTKSETDTAETDTSSEADTDTDDSDSGTDTPVVESYGPDNVWYHATVDDVQDSGQCGSNQGEQICNFTMVDQNGDNVELYQFWGQVIVIDVFAEW